MPKSNVGKVLRRELREFFILIFVHLQELCPFQAELYKRLVQSKEVEQVLDKQGNKAMILSLLNVFLKMANHPALLMNSQPNYGAQLLERALGEEFICDHFDQFSEENLENCGKLKVRFYASYRL